MRIKYFVNDLPNTFDMSNIKQISIDTEALGLQIKRDRLCVVQLMIDNTKDVYIVHFPDNNAYDHAVNLKTLLSNDKIEKIFHFARFDVAILYQYLGIMVKNIRCTRILSKFTRTYSERHGLKELCRELLKIDLNKGEQSSYWAAPDLKDSQKNYAANDVLYLPEIFNLLKERAEKENRYELIRKVFDIVETIVLVDLNDFNSVNIIEH